MRGTGQGLSQTLTMDDSKQAELRKRLDRISEIFGTMASHAEDVSQSRCPYRDRLDRCTALFSCRNQRKAGDGETEAFQCGHDGTFDYRSAWESHPLSHEKARLRIKKIRSEAEAARRSPSDSDAQE